MNDLISLPPEDQQHKLGLKLFTDLCNVIRDGGGFEEIADVVPKHGAAALLVLLGEDFPSEWAFNWADKWGEDFPSDRGTMRRFVTSSHWACMWAPVWRSERHFMRKFITDSSDAYEWARVA